MHVIKYICKTGSAADLLVQMRDFVCIHSSFPLAFILLAGGKNTVWDFFALFEVIKKRDNFYVCFSF